ncbi:hypothetical protein TRFO_18134 [Tritrichomonas foetus]|uniref:Uncharacterized protein n=1 Tax=Tritrichomonas foetus TaxID=1144522 RepID=A0A1J4KRX9_9EUKA|nr:hypothetical protein TRFO_18134 [Tritrichomonas foetus]|eukprot:OHT12221.1 hypothetical protein TRFO_18134 [Tritrichomonas foetus]
MIRRLAFEHLHVAEPSEEERKRARDECKDIIEIYGKMIDIFGIVHLFIAGCALAYIVILLSTSNFALWCAFFTKISLFADIFFFVLTFLIFISNFILVAIMYQLKITNVLAKGLLTVSASLLGLSLFLTTFSFPMSYMLKQSVRDYGEWYISKFAEDGAKSIFFGTYKNLAVARMVLLFISSLIFPYFVSSSRYITFQQLYRSMR